jgi:hypothetical protein
MADFDASQGGGGFGVLALILGHIHFGVLVAGEGFGLKLLGVAEGRLILHQLRLRQYLVPVVLLKLDVEARPVQAFLESGQTASLSCWLPAAARAASKTIRCSGVIQEQYACELPAQLQAGNCHQKLREP